MRFEDIPQLTRSAGYAVDVPIRMLTDKIVKWVEKEGLQLEPDFQRAHVWSDTQRTRYIEFLLRGGKSSRDLYFNHTRWNKAQGGWFVLVDGLQRLTSLMMFMDDRIPAFGLLHSQYEDEIDFLQTVKIHVNDLATRVEVLQWYIDLNAGGVAHTDDEIARVRALLDAEKARG